MSESDNTFRVNLTRESGYRIRAEAEGREVASFILDEPPPLGEGEGASPSHVLAAAIGGCLTASFLFCMDKAKVGVGGMSTRVEGRTERNDQGRLRITGLKVVIEPEFEDPESARIARCLDIFEDFCTVSKSVAQGIPFTVDVAGFAEDVGSGDDAATEGDDDAAGAGDEDAGAADDEAGAGADAASEGDAPEDDAPDTEDDTPDRAPSDVGPGYGAGAGDPTADRDA